MKTCSKCAVAKPIADFGNDKNRKDGKTVYCKECLRQINKVTRKKHNAKRTDHNKRYRDMNRTKYNQWERDYYEQNRDKLNTKSKKWRDNENGTFTMMHLSARIRARKKNLEYVLSPEIIRNLCTGQRDKCALTGIPFDYSMTEEFRNRPFAPSIDRKDSRKGYTLDNVQITCVMANKAKNEYHQEMFDAMCLARAKVLHAKI